MKKLLMVMGLTATLPVMGLANAQVTSEAKTMIEAQMKQAAHVAPVELKKELDSGKKITILDIRQTSERPKAGLITVNDVHVPRGYLEIKGFGALPDKNAEIVVYCGKGIRSAFAVNTLKEMGYKNVRNLKGGAFEWKQQGFETLPVK